MLHSSPLLMVFTLERLEAVIFPIGVSAGPRAESWHGQVHGVSWQQCLCLLQTQLLVIESVSPLCSFMSPGKLGYT